MSPRPSGLPKPRTPSGFRLRRFACGAIYCYSAKISPELKQAFSMPFRWHSDKAPNCSRRAPAQASLASGAIRDGTRKPPSWLFRFLTNSTWASSHLRRPRRSRADSGRYPPAVRRTQGRTVASFTARHHGAFLQQRGILGIARGNLTMAREPQHRGLCVCIVFKPWCPRSPKRASGLPTRHGAHRRWLRQITVYDAAGRRIIVAVSDLLPRSNSVQPWPRKSHSGAGALS